MLIILNAIENLILCSSSHELELCGIFGKVLPVAVAFVIYEP